MTEPDTTDRTSEPGTMHAAFWSVCRACGDTIHGPGARDMPCPCGQHHPRGDIQVLTDVPGHGRAWVHAHCADQTTRTAVAA